jgi:hypothetical protein
MRNHVGSAKKSRPDIEVRDRQPLEGMTTVAVPAGR